MSDDITLPGSVRAIVVDTNATGNGQFDIEMLGTLAKALTKLPEIEIWIPEPVMWEWAAHAQQIYNEYVEKNNAASKRLGRTGIALRLSRIQDAERQDIQRAILRRIEELDHPFRILQLKDYPEIAITALQDQVLLRTPAKRKSDVKTGAADSASLRLACTAAANRDIDWVIVSADPDISRALQEWQISTAKIFPNIKALRTAILATEPIEIRFVRSIYQGAWQQLGDFGTGVVSLGEIHDAGISDKVLGGSNRYLSLDLQVESLRHIVSLRSVEVDHEANLGTAEIVALGDVEVAGWNMDHFGDKLVADYGTAYDGLITIAMTFTVAAEDAVDVRVEDCRVSPRETRFIDGIDALENLLRAISEMPGFAELPSSRSGILAGPTWVRTINGKSVAIIFDGSGDRNNFCEWTVTSKVGSSNISISGHFEEPGVNGEIGDEVRPSFVISSNDGLGLHAMTRFLLTRVYDVQDLPEAVIDDHGMILTMSIDTREGPVEED
ncbi:hypothetical protein [Nonomuraea sp. NPDC049684]|uniref:hypothetical protein n=1 Tax=Nonomuraea sp. NPDC049684 TaxID=3364356 RepID=UPI00379A77F1